MIYKPAIFGGLIFLQGGDTMNNYFTFDGVDSSDFGLYIAYFDGAPNVGVAGGKYELSVDTIPTNPQQIYYGKNYSTQPLEFQADIMLESLPDNSEEDYTEQWADINDWLFGADGYKKFYMSNTADYNYLQCVIIPLENLYIGGKQIGARVLIHNDSPFWYNDNNITFDFTGTTADENGEVLFTKNIDSATEIKVFPTINFKPQNVSGGNIDYFLFRVLNLDNNSEFRTYIKKQDSNKDWVIDCRYLTITANNELRTMNLGNTQPTRNWFYLSDGLNRIKVNVLDTNGNSAPFQYLNMDYTKYIRKGEIIV